MSEGNYYKSLEDAKSSLTAIYSPLRSGAFVGPYFLQTEIMADYAEGRGSTLIIGEYQGLDVTNITRVAGIWTSFYSSIRNANISIANIPSIDADQAVKNALVAEARFMRALVYYHLVRHWGPVPLYLTSTTTESPRKPVDEVYASIIEDLQYGEQHLPATPEVFGKPTKWSASSLLAEVYLTRKQWALAKTKAEEVINSKAYSLVEIASRDDWNKVFGANVNGTSEEVFYLKFNNQYGWEWPTNLLWSETKFSPFGNYVIYSTLDNKFLNNWDPKDLRKQWDVFTEYENRNTGVIEKLPVSTPVQFSKWRDPAAPTTIGHANDYPFLRFADVLLIHAEADARANNGPTAAGIESLNKIRRRAYGYPVTGQSPVDYPATGWDVERFVDTVLTERAYELFMEGKRWLDLKRTDKIKSTILQNLGKEVKDVHLFWPIPQQEIDTNPFISQADQNPGY
ncbi:MAG: RagB/SusD family nutrient uptake outer membrane protein [Larkinella arboricola]